MLVHAIHMRRKTGDMIATAIEQEIISGRYQIGASLGTEAELCARYGVSRWALREAVAIVQNDGLIVVRRGRGGGTVVDASPERSLAAAVCGFLLYVWRDVEQLIDARMIVDRLLYEFAARAVEREVPPSALALLAKDPATEDRATASEAILDQILILSGNPFVAMFGLALSKLMSCRLALAGEMGVAPDPAVSDRLLLLRRRQLDSIVGVDVNGAITAAADMAELWRRLLIPGSGERSAPFPGDGRQIAERLAEVLHPGQDLRGAGIVSALLMIDTIKARTTPSGLIGSETALTERYGVPRNMLREGVRILERDGFVRAETGRNGGIRVGEPDMTALVDRAARIFAFLHLRPQAIDLLAQELRMLAIQLAMAESSGVANGRRDLASCIRNCSTQPDWRAALFLLLADRSSNRFLMLFERICLRFAKGLGLRDQPPPDKHLLNELADTIENGDIGLPRRHIARIHRNWMMDLVQR